MAVFELKIREVENIGKVIKVLRAFDPTLSIGDIRKRIDEYDFLVEYDLLHWEATEDLDGIDRISRFKSLIRALEDSGAMVDIFENKRFIGKMLFDNRVQMLREIAQEVAEDIEREVGEE